MGPILNKIKISACPVRKNDCIGVHSVVKKSWGGVVWALWSLCFDLGGEMWAKQNKKLCALCGKKIWSGGCVGSVVSVF